MTCARWCSRSRRRPPARVRFAPPHYTCLSPRRPHAPAAPCSGPHLAHVPPPRPCAPTGPYRRAVPSSVLTAVQTSRPSWSRRRARHIGSTSRAPTQSPSTPSRGCSAPSSRRSSSSAAASTDRPRTPTEAEEAVVAQAAERPARDYRARGGSLRSAGEHRRGGGRHDAREFVPNHHYRSIGCDGPPLRRDTPLFT